MLATYGMRPHEVFFCSAEDLLDESNTNCTIEVGKETKTGSRIAYPLKDHQLQSQTENTLRLTPNPSVQAGSSGFRHCGT